MNLDTYQLDEDSEHGSHLYTDGSSTIISVRSDAIIILMIAMKYQMMCLL